MSSVRVVGLGDPISRIAFKAGFRDGKTVWNAGENAELRTKRDNPEVLARGDEVFVPDFERRDELASTTKRHVFVAKRSPLSLVVRHRAFPKGPLASTEIDVDGITTVTAPKVTNGDGVWKATIHPTEERVSLRFDALDVPLAVGHLEPVTELAGVRARLANMGYLVGRVDAEDDEDETWFAIEDFQADAGLPPTGMLDAATRAALVTEHGS